VGSTVKPFLSLAYVGAFPNTRCEGHVGFREALAYSCNPYFLELARNVSPDALARVSAIFEIAGPADDSAATFIGLGRGWRIAPIDLVRAYAELGARRSIPRVAEILAGLELAAERGTASAIGRGALAKTGTAECIAERRHAGDGFTVVLDPADAPRVAMIVRVHNVPGAEAAKVAAQILRVVRTGK
jgi:cell division protein FtsI/penicillin-binding protein 2